MRPGLTTVQRPPDRSSPSVLFTRATSGWISRVNQKHNQLADLGLSPEQKERLDRWTETEFVHSALKLEGEGLTREDVAEIVSRSPDSLAENVSNIVRLLVSLRTVTSLAREHGKAAVLTAQFLKTLHGGSAAGFRKSAGDISRTPRPVPPEHLPALIESACLWYTAESFAELNPVEQASIVLLRLIDIQPFEQENERTALVAASLFTLASELPPIIIKPEMTTAYRNALDEATGMNTKPMVETVGEAVERSLNEMLEQVGTQVK